MAKVIKTLSELYQVRHDTFEGWGDVFLICGPESVRVTINSDYGVFAHNWSHCGGNPKQFLTEIDFDYCLKKLTGHKHYIKDPKQYPDEVKRSIIEARRECGNLTREQARQAWDEMLAFDHDEGDLYFKELIDHELFNLVFGDYESLPCATVINPLCQELWDHVWLPFVKQIKEELAETNKEPVSNHWDAFANKIHSGLNVGK